MGLRFPADLDAWRAWHERRHPLRLARSRVARSRLWAAPPGGAVAERVEVRRGAPDADLLVAVEATHASVAAAVTDVLPHLDPARLVVVSPVGAPLPIPLDSPATALPVTDVGGFVGDVRGVLAAGHYSPIGAAAHDHATRVGAAFLVAQHGLLTPFAPPLPPRARLLAWSDADAEFWTEGRPDVAATVVGSQLLWRAAATAAPSVAPEDAPVYLGQLHAAELSRARLARAAGRFCRAHGATYRPHPSERDRLSRLLHAWWRRRGIRVRADGPPLADLAAPVVSVFSTGVLEAAARGLPAWVEFPNPPSWLREFWERYGMSRYGGDPTAPPRRPAVEPAAAIARILGKVP